MSENLQQWVDEFETYIQPLSDSIARLCKLTRENRNISGKYDGLLRETGEKSPAEFLHALRELLDAHAAAASFSARIKDTFDDDLSAALKPKGLLKTGAKHYGTVSRVLQLQDDFDQRMSHIHHGIGLAKERDAQSAMMMVGLVNAQAIGIAENIIDLTANYRDAAASLKKLIATELGKRQKCIHALDCGPAADDAQDDCTQDHATSATLAAIMDEACSALKSSGSDEAHDTAKDLFDKVDKYVHAQSGYLQEATTGLDGLCVEVAELEKTASTLAIFANSFDQFTEDFDMSSGMNSMVEMAQVYTMESERSIHEAVMKRYGLS